MLRRVNSAISLLLTILMILPLTYFAGAENSMKTEGMYTDMSKTHWSYEDVSRCKENGWIEGYPDGSFLPENPVTRAEAIKIAVDFLGRRKAVAKDGVYKDVSADAWYAPYIFAAEDLVPLSWKINKRIEPDKAMTREETVYLIMTAMGYDKEVPTANPFLIINAYSDNAEISDMMKPYFSLATSKGIISGYDDGTAKPNAEVTRAQFAAMLCRAEDSKEKNRLRDEFANKYDIYETNAIGVPGALLMQSTGDYFIVETNASEDGYYELLVDYSHDCYEITTKIKVIHPDGNEVDCNRGILSGRQKLSIPVYLKKGINKVRFQHSLRQLPHYILPLYIYNVKCVDKAEELEYKISPNNAKLFLDNPKTPLTVIKNWKEKLVKIETRDGENIPFEAETLGESVYTEAMLKVYPDLSKLSAGKHTLSYHLENGRVLTQVYEIAETTPQHQLEYINFSVDKANSTLIKLPNGKNLLVDSGYDSTAKELIIPYLEKNNVKLDYYILTHFHKDHYGLKDEILEMNGIEKPLQEKADELVTASREERYNYLKNFGYLDSSMVCYYDELDKIWDLGGVKVEILNSRFTENGEKADVYNFSFYRIDEHNYENATSISFMLEYNGFRYYHAADNYAFAQERYMSDMIKHNRTEELYCDWYFGNHHFQYDMSPKFIKTLNPIAVYVPNNDGVYPRASYTQHYIKEVENSIFFGKRLTETLISYEVGSARVCVNSADDWYYETIADEDMYK